VSDRIDITAEIHLRLIEHFGKFFEDWKAAGITISKEAADALIEDVSRYVMRDLSAEDILELAEKYVHAATQRAFDNLSD
jgi:hypothetical protein